jgi:hypothetical protein
MGEQRYSPTHSRPRHWMEVSGLLHAPATLSLGKSPWYPLDRRLGGPQSRSGRGGEEKNFQPLPGLEPPIIQPAVQHFTTEIFWLGAHEKCQSLYSVMLLRFETGTSGIQVWNIIATTVLPLPVVSLEFYPRSSSKTFERSDQDESQYECCDNMGTSLTS